MQIDSDRSQRSVSCSNVAHAVPLAETLLANDIKTIEITLRTAAALDAIKAIVSHCPEMLVGAEAILSGDLAQKATSAGANFIVSPGTTDAVIKGCNDAQLLLLPDWRHHRSHGTRMAVVSQRALP